MPARGRRRGAPEIGLRSVPFRSRGAWTLDREDVHHASPGLPVLIRSVTDHVDQTRRGRLAPPDFQLRGVWPGQAVGVHFLRGLAPVNRILPVKGEAELADAVQIYAFDMLIQNPDRRGDNPNCGNFRGRLVAYDHEMAFSFLYPIVGGGEPWEVPSFARRHIFHPPLAVAARNSGVDWQPVRRAIVALGERVNGIAQFVPAPWRSHAEKVTTHVQGVVGRAATFEDQLRRSLL
jgi:hypothetical protein